MTHHRRISPASFLLLLIIPCLTIGPRLAQATPLIINLQANDIVYSSATNLIYAAVPNSSATNPNTLTPINVTTGALQTAVNIGFDPRALTVGSDGTLIHAAVADNVVIQPYQVVTQSSLTPYVLTGGVKVREMYAVPGRPGAVIAATRDPRYSPTATGTIVFENGARLPNQVGNGVGTGGPDIIAVDLSNGNQGYGYLPSLSSYTHYDFTLDANGVTSTSSPLQGVMSGNVGHIDRLGNRLFNSSGNVYSINPGFQVGTFIAGETYLLDPDLNRLYSLASDTGSTKTFNAYRLDTLQLLGSETISGISGSSRNLIRVGAGGLAFETTGDQIVLFESQLVPEPESWAMMGIGLAALLLLAVRRKRLLSGRG